MKKTICALLAFLLCLSLCTPAALAQEQDVFAIYDAAVQKTVASGFWSEELTIDMEILLSSDSTTMKSKGSMTSNMDISGYDPNDLRELKVVGTASMDMLEEQIAFSVVYENGIARYEYTKPSANVYEVAIQPDFFDFQSIDRSTVKNADIQGNQISYTIPGKEMNDVAQTVLDTASGMKDVRYSDASVAVTLNNITGAIEGIEMSYDVEAVIQGYDAEIHYEMDYRFKSGMDTVIDLSDTEDGLVICSDFDCNSIPLGGTIRFAVGICQNHTLMDSVSNLECEVADRDILSSVDVSEDTLFFYVELKGTEVGTTAVTFWDDNTGYTATLYVTVYKPTNLTYPVGSVPEFKANGLTVNVYNYSGLYVDSYSCTVRNDNSAYVTFDVYNENRSYGIVEVFDAKGNLESASLIERMEDGNSSIKEAVWDNTIYLLRDLIINRTAFTYRQESGVSKRTPVEAEIPAGGYIRITADSSSSPILYVVNAISLIGNSAEVVGDSNEHIDIAAVAEEYADKISKAEMYKNVADALVEEAKDLHKEFGKEFFVSTQVHSSFINSLASSLQGMDAGSLLGECFLELGFGTFETFFTKASGIAGKFLDGFFLFSNILELILQSRHFNDALFSGSIVIQNQSGAVRSFQQIEVECESKLPDDVALNVFRLEIDQEQLERVRKMSPKVYREIVEGLSRTYDISFQKNGVETQITGKATVRMPIPEEMELLAYSGRVRIYRINEDGTTAKMDVKIRDGYFVFDTDHFSMYTLVGSETSAMFVVAVVAVAVFSALLLIILLTVKYHRRKKRSMHPNVSADSGRSENVLYEPPKPEIPKCERPTLETLHYGLPMAGSLDCEPPNPETPTTEATHWHIASDL